MSVHALRRWHWAVIGLLAGLALGFARHLGTTDDAVGGPGFIDQKKFEQSLRVPPVRGKPYVGGIAIRRTPGIDRVTLSVLTAAWEYEDVKFAAPRRYRPLGQPAPARADYTVQDYLNEVRAGNPALSYREPWWEEPTPMLSACGVAGLLVVGGVWPTVLRRFAPPAAPEAAYDLDRFHGGPDPAKAEPSDAGRQHLAELESELSAVLEAGANGVSSPLAPAVRSLESQPVEAAAAATDEAKEYAGEFYPVEKKAPHGFGLVELLVVIGIVAILTALLMPTLRVARLQSETVQCASQLRQIGMGLQMYATDNRGSLPAWSGWKTWPAGIAGDTPGVAWTIEMIPYLGTPDSPIYNCPSFPIDQKWRNYFLAGQWSGRSGRRSMKLTDVTMAGRFVLAGDKTQRQLYPMPMGQGLNDDADPDDYGAPPCLAWPWQEGGFYMHRGGNNILFDDMHVALFGDFDPAAMTFHPHKIQDWAEVTGD